MRTLPIQTNYLLSFRLLLPPYSILLLPRFPLRCRGTHPAEEISFAFNFSRGIRDKCQSPPLSFLPLLPTVPFNVSFTRDFSTYLYPHHFLNPLHLVARLFFAKDTPHIFALSLSTATELQ